MFRFKARIARNSWLLRRFATQELNILGARYEFMNRSEVSLGMDGSRQFIRWFSEISNDDVPLVGGKNASLGEMFQTLCAQDVRVPDGFAITAEAYRSLLDNPGVREKLHVLLDAIDSNDTQSLAQQAQQARELIYHTALPPRLREEILAALHELQSRYAQPISVAIRSSATAEDLPSASFAGQHDSYLNVSGDEAVLDACKQCFASLFTERAIQYRINNGFDHFKVALSIGVMKMVRADRAASGVMFTLDTDSGFRDVVFITGVYGLGETIVQGAVDPDEFFVHKPTFELGYRTVLRRRLGEKQVQMVYASETAVTQTLPTPETQRRQFCISDDEVLKLAAYAMQIEKHYSERAGHDQPMDIEWAKDGIDGELYIVQARPETVASQQVVGYLESYRLLSRVEPLLTGRAVGGKIGIGRVRVIEDAAALDSFETGDVLVSDITTPDWVSVMKRASAIVTNRGGRTCHAAIVARELGVPAIVGTTNATKLLHSGDSVTVSCAEGESGYVYAGELPFEIEQTQVESLPAHRTKIMLNVANPEHAFAVAMIPSDGVGLVRLEFIIGETIGAHPLALLHPERVANEGQRLKLTEISQLYHSHKVFYIDTLTEGVATIAAAFYPRPVIVRLADFKSNEYAQLLGGEYFEPREENPMLGLRGAARYVHPDFVEAFALECAAMKKVRETMGLHNVKLMIPFCRAPQEAEAVLAAMAKNGLVRGEQGLEVYLMVELPSNVLQLDEFAPLFDGFSIGSNDLMQLTLGVDRDSALISSVYDARNASVKQLMKQAVEAAKRAGKPIGICGQAPSDFPEVAQFLVELGIDSMSLNADSVISVTRAVADYENRLF
jgi:pyruvate, water dikinase